MRGVASGWLIAALIFGLGSSVSAGQSSDSTTVPTPNPSALALVRGVNDSAHQRNLDVRQLKVRVLVHGSIAEAEVEMRVFATTAEPVEGRVHFDLPAGAVVTGYALDVGGAMIDGSLVDAPKARAAYEQQVRQQVDPGVASLDAVGGFNTRVSPIDDKTGRTVRLRFVAPVGSEFLLPLQLANARDGWTVEVAGLGGQHPRARLGGEELDAADGVARAGGRGRLDALLSIIAAPSPVVVSRHPTGETYWQAMGALSGSAGRAGGTVRILWDRSRSRRDHDHAAELRRLREALDALAPDRIEWVAFSSGAPQGATVASFDDVRAKAAGLRYAGATSLQTIAGDAAAVTCLLVSDGRATFDSKPVGTLPCRVFAIASDRSADRVRLTALASATGGQVVETGSAKVDWHASAVEAVLDAAGNRLEFASLLAPAGQWRIALRAPSSGPVRIRVGGQLVERQAQGAPVAFAGEGALLAATRLAALDGTASRKDFVDLSRRYSIASGSLSFVVLERPEDYVASDITPPATYHQLAQWRELRAEADEDEAADRANRFDDLLKAWSDQVAWWEKEFDLAARPQAVRRKATAPGLVRNEPGPPPPPPPPPPPSEPERDGSGEEALDSDVGNIVVTGTRVPVANLASPTPVTVVEGSTGSGGDTKISVSAWRPQRDYLDAYDADPVNFDRLFGEWDKKAGDVPAFYLDTADWLARHGRKEAAAEILLSALDLPSADAATLGMVATRLERYGLVDQAIMLRERHAQIDPDRPQPRRLLALALARRALTGATAKADLKRAVSLLTEIALTPVEGRWDGIDLISLTEANAFLARLRQLGGDVAIDPRLVRNLDSDVRVTLDWSNDDADIDLWVDEPNGERAIYSHPRTLIGGHLSNDMTDGYGPEEYFLRRAAQGRFIVRANVYSPDQLDPNGPSRVTAHLYRDWGRPTQRHESIDLDLVKGQRGEVRIGTLTVEKSASAAAADK